MEDNMFLKEDFKMARIARHYAKSDTYCVGAVLKCKNGNKYIGCNLENASHISIPAEIVAFTKALSDGEQCFERLVIVGGAKDTDKYSKYVPCKEAMEFMQVYVDNDFMVYNIYETIEGKSEVITYTIESLEKESLSFLDNYCLKMTERYYRYYYSATPRFISEQTKFYEIQKNLEITTEVGPIDVKDFSYKKNGVLSIVVEFYNDDAERETVEITNKVPKTITIMEGNPDVSRESVCMLEIVQKNS